MFGNQSQPVRPIAMDSPTVHAHSQANPESDRTTASAQANVFSREAKKSPKQLAEFTQYVDLDTDASSFFGEDFQVE
jgi:hypothetical protein